MNLKLLIFTITLALIKITPGAALPPPADLPEEVLRTQIITEGRSPVNGKPLTAAEYAEEVAKLKETSFPPQLNPKIQERIFWLEILKFLRIVTPF
ncbi:MAG: hypothetical protein DSM107014_12065 [Gomphosphaeria aponina SAG 52.96 = DSM 107014]|uniref:Glutathione S-transferase n=1 Tax=Gomphosphaeria aponina SAG 52.96 = DSM 107014 TaxID=1521640 RepID=A0A941JMU5_9CHRO|nr:hypothetical protein [Gomphosphaeria aponina SAG 52.96 = DSM 107014]